MDKKLLEKNEYFVTSTGDILFVIREKICKHNISLIIKTSNNTILYNTTCPDLDGSFTESSQILNLDSTEAILEGEELTIILLLDEGSETLLLSDINQKNYLSTHILQEILEEQQKTNKLLTKIYNPE